MQTSRRFFQDIVSGYLGYPLVLTIWDGEVRRARRLLRSKEELHRASPEEIRAMQAARLRRLLLHCERTVPYYREIFRAAGLDLSAPDVLRDFSRLPMLSKDILQERAADLLSGEAQSSRRYPNSSGGSTGRMVNFVQDQEYRDQLLASTWASNRMQGWRPGSRIAILWGAPRDVRELQTARARLRLYLENTRLYDAFDMGPRRMDAYHRSLSEFRPHVLLGYASSIHLLARHLLERRVTCAYPEVSIISSAELLTPEMRKEIERALPAPVFDRYGSREVGLIASECEHHDGLHLNISDLVLECVDEEGRPLPDDSPGELVVTVLTNYTMPFVRYRLEDVGILTTARCTCGRQSLRIRKVLGRSSDIIVSPAGRWIQGEYFTHLFYGLPEIRQFQFIQESLQRFRVLVVPGDGFRPETTRSIECEMACILGDQAVVTWEVVSAIPPLPSGKHRFTINRMAGRLPVWGEGNA